MPFSENNGTQAFHFELFHNHPVNQAIFTRHGGMSPAPWHSLNVGGTVGDDLERVHENRKKVLDAYGRQAASLHDVWQVHSADVVHADQPRGSDPPQKADIIITANPEITLFMRFADCVPIYLYDPVTPAIGMAHAGWLGTVRRAAEIAVRAMQSTFGSMPQKMLAGIGPSIGPDHYEVGQDVIDAFNSSFGARASEHILQRGPKRFLDLWSANKSLLEEQGVGVIEIAGICTVCENNDWYSHRAEKGKTGRFAALFNLEMP